LAVVRSKRRKLSMVATDSQVPDAQYATIDSHLHP
jgi:hypothetical protein